MIERLLFNFSTQYERRDPSARAGPPILAPSDVKLHKSNPTYIPIFRLNKLYMWITELSELNKLNKSIDELWVRGTKIKSLKFLSHFPGLIRLFLSSIKTDNLDALRSLKKLKYLELTNVGSGASLQPISELDSLEELILQTPAGWDGSSKTIRYDSLKPLIKLKSLKNLTLLNVTFDFDGLKPLINIESLSELTTRNIFTTEEFAVLSKYKPKLDCRYTQPYTTWEGVEYYRCKTCGGMKVEFSGVDLKRRVFCLNCNKAKCEELIERFNKIRNDA
jgi:hypothetical protein